MKVRDLIATLKKIDGEAEILLHFGRSRFAPPVYVGPVDTADPLEDDQNIQLVISPWESSDPEQAHLEFLQSGIEIRDVFGATALPGTNLEGVLPTKDPKMGTEIYCTAREVGGPDDLNIEEQLLAQKDQLVFSVKPVMPAVAAGDVTDLDPTPEQLPASSKTRHSDDDELAADIGELGYPGYGHLQGQLRSPAEVLFDALDRPDLDARIVEALPWLPLQYPDMDWNWLTTQAKIHNRQNRLGFVVALSAGVAKKQGKSNLAKCLFQVVKTLEEGRLANTDTLCQESWPSSQRNLAHKQRSALAAHWKLDTRLTERNLAHLDAQPGAASS
jgi:hypothetical protein